MKAVLMDLAVTILLSVIIWPLVSLLLAWPFSLLWNTLVPKIFGFPTISFWEAVGLMLLTSILFRWRWRVSIDRNAGRPSNIE